MDYLWSRLRLTSPFLPENSGTRWTRKTASPSRRDGAEAIATSFLRFQIKGGVFDGYAPVRIQATGRKGRERRESAAGGSAQIHSSIFIQSTAHYRG